VNLAVRLYEEHDALVIPAQAVQTGADGQYVYIIDDEMLAQVRRIEVQRTEGERAIVAKGLSGGERVVTRGQLRLAPKTRVQVAKPAATAS
jgi:multidrug efflux system membrane fusion protein